MAGIERRQIDEGIRKAAAFDPGVIAAGPCFRGCSSMKERKRKPSYGGRTKPSPVERANHRDWSPRQSKIAEIVGPDRRRVKTDPQWNLCVGIALNLSNLAR
jgi:hypothetical protein